MKRQVLAQEKREGRQAAVLMAPEVLKEVQEALLTAGTSMESMGC
jgi:hypothetical protein